MGSAFVYIMGVNTNIKKRIISYLSVFILVFLFCIFVNYVCSHLKKSQNINELATYVEINPSLHKHESDWFDSAYTYFSSKQIQELKEKYKASVMANDDIKYIISFSSGLLTKSILNSDYYKDIDFISGINNGWGSIYISEDGDVIYGRYLSEDVSSNRNLLFTPLSVLKDEDYYKDNKYFMLMGKSEIIYYVIVSVNDKDLVPYYETDEIIEDENLLTIVVSDYSSDDKEIIVCKEIGREASFNDE